MTIRFLIGGSGGQGVQIIGKMLTYACNEAGYYVTFFPSYGGAMRGGVSNCTVVVSDEQIGAPNPEMVDCAVALCSESYEVLMGRIAEYGSVLYEKSLVRPVDPPKNAVAVSPISIAESAGMEKMANFVMLGIIAQHIGDIGVDVFKTVIDENLKWPSERKKTAFEAVKLGLEQKQ